MGAVDVNMTKEFQHILKALKRLPQELRREKRKEILRKAAKPLISEAQARAPVMRDRKRTSAKLKEGRAYYYPGNLQRSIRIIEFKGSGDVFVGPKVAKRRRPGAHYGKNNRTVDAFYAAIVEFGSRNFPAKPFMRPAFDATKTQILDIATTEMARVIDEWAKKHRR